ncbi:unnamed protein product [Adineta ricciae]|uniref:Major facilitator superfamily associated domain-containing protein n=1 Tax=Adineta ricciae TaxID=249248 RepID=A0A814AVW9_ADIRI|nr:unnamed protein product [Adineta ricciae]CAF1611548.1 unnamed protein product [Adineta ricciae]
MESPSMLAPTASVVSSSPFIHRRNILLKAHYFLFFSAFGALYPVLSITLRSRGLSNTEISYINIIIPFLVFFTNPLVGFIADQSRRYLFTFNVVLGTVIILYGSMFLLPEIKTEHIKADMTYDRTSGGVLDFCASQEVATKCSSRSECGCSYNANCNTNAQSFAFDFKMNSTDTRQDFSESIGTSEPARCGIHYRVPIDAYLDKFKSNLTSVSGSASPIATCEITCSIAHYCHGSRYPQQTHYLLLYSLLFIIGTNLLSNSITLGASIGFASIPRAELFGSQRVFGTIGFGISALTASKLYEYFSTHFVYIILFIVYAFLCILITCFIRIQSHKQKRASGGHDTGATEEIGLDSSLKNANQDMKKKNSSKSGLPALIPLLKRIDVIVFLSLTFIWGMSYAGLDPYVYLYIDEIAPCQSRSIVGYMSFISASSEIVALFLAGKMLELLGVNINSIIILLAFAIRFAGYYYIRRPYFLLFMETMHYFNFGILYILIAQRADAIAPPGLAGTLQGVVYGLSFGLGRGVGLIVSSFIYTRLQSRTLFLFFALFNTAAAIIYSLIFFILKKRSEKNVRSNHNTNVPKIVIDPDTSVHEDPLLVPGSSSTGKTDNKFAEQ